MATVSQECQVELHLRCKTPDTCNCTCRHVLPTDPLAATALRYNEAAADMGLKPRYLKLDKLAKAPAHLLYSCADAIRVHDSAIAEALQRVARERRRMERARSLLDHVQAAS